MYRTGNLSGLFVIKVFLQNWVKYRLNILFLTHVFET